MDKQLENGYKDTAFEIAGKCINIKSGYCILLKSIVLYFGSSSMHVCYESMLCQYLVCLQLISFYFQPNMSNDCKLL